MNELGLRFLYKLISNNTFTVSIITLDWRVNQNYKEKKRRSQTNLNLRKLDQRDIEEQSEKRDNNQQPTCINGKPHTDNQT